MKSFRSKPVGWRGESHRHYLAAKGVKTRNKYYAYAPTYTGADLSPIAVDAVGTTGAAVVPWIPVAVPLLLAYGGAKYMKKRKDKTGSYFVKKPNEKMVWAFKEQDLNEMERLVENAESRGESTFVYRDQVISVDVGRNTVEELKQDFSDEFYASKAEEFAAFEDAKGHGNLMQASAKMAFENMEQEDRAKVMKFLNEQFKKGGEALANSDESAEEIVRFHIKVMDEKFKKEKEKKENEQHFAKKREELPSWETTQHEADKLALDEARYRKDAQIAREVEEMYPAAVTSGEFKPSVRHAKNAASTELDFGIVESILGDIEKREGNE